MKPLPITEKALVVRTGFAHEAAWRGLKAALLSPPDPFVFDMRIIEDREYSGASLEGLIECLPHDYPHSFFVIADDVACTGTDYPLRVVDLLVDQEFRAASAHVPSIANNLSIANMDFEEFAHAVDETRVFRGFPDSEP